MIPQPAIKALVTVLDAAQATGNKVHEIVPEIHNPVTGKPCKCNQRFADGTDKIQRMRAALMRFMTEGELPDVDGKLLNHKQEGNS